MIAVVVDTNTLVSGLGWSRPPSAIVDALLAGGLVLVSSPPLLDELERVLAYPKLAHVFDDPVGITALVRSVAKTTERRRWRSSDRGSPVTYRPDVGGRAVEPERVRARRPRVTGGRSQPTPPRRSP